jgi:hypothetical protein
MNTNVHMDLQVTEKKTFKDMQEEFNRVYPFLWIDFYYSNPGYGAGNSGKIKPETVIKKQCALNQHTVININSNKSVAQLEDDFIETLNVKIKVLRKSGNVWVGTSYTRNWTLDNQNFQGQQIVID